MRRSLLLVALVLSSACAGRRAHREALKMEGNFVVSPPGENWQAVKPGGADFAWFNTSLGASIYADSNCGVRFEDAPLEKLAEHHHHGVTSQGEVDGWRWVLDGRDAYTVKGTGRMDGIAVGVGTTVVKKGFCVYDLVLIAPSDTLDDAWAAYEASVRSFRTLSQ